jgi:hypothetical protein
VRGPNAVHHGHVYVQKDYVRLQLDNLFNGFFSVSCLAAYTKRVPIKETTNRGASDRVVINDEDSVSQFASLYQLRGEGRVAARNRQHIVIAEAFLFNTGEALINPGREPEISTSGTAVKDFLKSCDLQRPAIPLRSTHRELPFVQPRLWLSFVDLDQKIRKNAGHANNALPQSAQANVNCRTTHARRCGKN